MATYSLKPGDRVSSKSILIWRIAQTLIWSIGIGIVFCLVFYPTLGIHLFWNILIPIAPLLLVVATGLWRNICPMGSTALFPRHMNWSKRKKLTTVEIAKLNLISVVALFILVPLRHAFFNLNAMATALLIISLGLVAIIVGLRYEWKSAWCSGLCPVHPVEKLYGLKNKLKLPNAHCSKCHRCVAPCPDKTSGITPLTIKKTMYHKIAGFLMVGAFPGFVWGWFQIPDYNGISNIEQLIGIYKLPVLGLLVTGILFLILGRFIKEKIQIAIFSASAVSCYYWFRIPALFGFGKFTEDGMLVDLTGVLPEWAILATVVVFTLFFFWWIVFSKQRRISWVIRPAYAKDLVNFGKFALNKNKE